MISLGEQPLARQIAKLKRRFALKHVVLIGARGLITQARIDDELKPAGLDWITGLRAPSIKALTEGGALRLDLFDKRDMAAITSPDYPDERLTPGPDRGLAAIRTLPANAVANATMMSYNMNYNKLLIICSIPCGWHGSPAEEDANSRSG